MQKENSLGFNYMDHKVITPAKIYFRILTSKGKFIFKSNHSEIWDREPIKFLRKIKKNNKMVVFAAAVLGYFAPQALLSAAGFTAAGIKAGSIAATIQGEFNH